MSPPKQDDSETPPATTFSSPPALIAFTLALVVVCFVGFSIVYFCRCYFVSIIHTWAFQRSTSGGNLVRLSSNNASSSSSSPNRGLDPSQLQAFPTFLYASVKDLRKDKYSLECAICLLEFEDDSMLRFLTLCCHVFHQECIDLWLCSHMTCPVCRKDLDSQPNEARKSQQERGEDNVIVEEGSRDDVCIDVEEGEGNEDVGAGDNERHDELVSMSMSLQQQREHKFARSHSTGHSIVLIRREDEVKHDDKYTLRLPEHVAVLKFVGGGGHNYSKSCSSYKEMPRPPAPCRNCGYVETVSGCSSRRGTENI